ncbi:AAA domain, putative AbiEii toxin, Type IV TA system [anaerobic digester metagenome]
MTKRTRANRLFLSVAQDLNDFHSSNVMSWFNDVLLFYNVLPKQQRFGLLSDPMMKEKMLKFLNYCGIDVVDLVVRTREINTDETFRKAMQLLIPNESSLLRESIEMEELFILYNRYHQSGEVAGTTEIPFENESSGTRKLIMIGFMLISQEHPRVMLMDEFDNALHLELSKALVKVINSPENKNQMIMRSHTLELMDCDLRVDQIYLMEKDFKGSSSVYSLFDFEDLPSVARSDIKFAKRYINGQFGAMPTIESDEISKVLFGGVDE